MAKYTNEQSEMIEAYLGKRFLKRRKIPCANLSYDSRDVMAHQIV